MNNETSLSSQDVLSSDQLNLKQMIEKQSVRVLPFDPDYQDTRLNSIKEELASILHKSLSVR